ncbi:copper amine oxidase N-terminal domain-containing protein [Paenibacillus sp. J5C_2022]|uniref:copper amine oxidase N-terminal domain-containing protein n=1 Tax=Paenibacillus sp. J5C2022 TaxID=2977129 RepID=UPI0021D3ABF5|nr:copper amine oxidase N-terminal domain-containing protein [Paenibacillus sp. J5C2022]MCU6709367.1 copper amine oxidase N-terminal domain-containing protein [Paenibacillus sp. J5C2022]
MKKIAAAFIAGALVMLSGQALAENLTRVGMKVGSEASVWLNDTQLSDAIVVNSKSYAPVRDIAEAFGAKVEYTPAEENEKAVISLVSKLEDSNILPEHKVIVLKQERESLVKEKNELEEGIPFLQNWLAKDEAELEKLTQDWMREPYLKSIEERKAAIESNKARLAEIESELAAIDAEIKSIESTEREPEVNEAARR